MALVSFLGVAFIYILYGHFSVSSNGQAPCQWMMILSEPLVSGGRPVYMMGYTTISHNVKLKSQSVGEEMA